MAMTANASYAHLLGSVPLADTETVFRAVCAELGPHIRRIPDGETGERLQWVGFQYQMLLNHPAMEEDPEVDLNRVIQRDGVPLRELNVPDGTELILGLIHYDDAEGDMARIAAAREFLPAFGVATECGWGRDDPSRVPGLLASHRRAVELLDRGN